MGAQGVRVFSHGQPKRKMISKTAAKKRWHKPSGRFRSDH